MSTSDPERRTVAIVLAAGKGTRMRSARPKVLHPVAGRPMLARVLAAARAAGCEQIGVVVGHQAAEVRAAFPEPDLVWLEQREQRGTGHALAQAAPLLGGPARVLVLSGDVPLVRPATLARLLDAAGGAFGALAVADLAAPGHLGRVLATAQGRLRQIVEARDADPATLAVHTVNAGIYALPAPAILDYLERLAPHNAQGELYLTDALSAAAADGHPIELLRLADASEALGINDRADLARVHRLLLDRHAAALAAAGVTLLEPARTSVEETVEIGEESVVHAAVTLLGATRIGRGVTVHTGAWIRDSEVADGAVVEPYSVLDGARIGPGCRVGPFARLRPGTVLEAGARVGNFVEVKNARLGAGAKANHLTYLGDAEVGPDANLGAGVVTCNYDGVAKHRTEIGAGAFVGSDTMLVAPVRVGAGATTGAGSVITRDVPDGALAVERAPTRVVPNWRRRRLEPGTEG